MHPVQHVEIGVGWHTGTLRQRRPNEDSLVTLQGTCTNHEQLVPFGLFVVADGMGGHFFGQEASQMAIQSMMRSVLQNILKSEKLHDDACIGILIDGVEQANRTICQYSTEKNKDMGTTLTAALLIDGKAHVINVGDSRTYHYREGEGLFQITCDHSLVANLVADGVITHDEMYTHPERNKIYRCVGSAEGVQVDYFTVEVRARDRLLLCSDGLWEMVRDPEIERILKLGTEAKEMSKQLVQAALDGGGADNIGVIVAHIL
jgi:serine/threonine protein phosphatase PrpC